MNNSRTEEAIKNINVVAVCQLISILIKFACKSFLIILLGKEYEHDFSKKQQGVTLQEYYNIFLLEYIYSIKLVAS